MVYMHCMHDAKGGRFDIESALAHHWHAMVRAWTQRVYSGAV